MTDAPKRGSAQLERQREWHGWSFRNYTAEQRTAIRLYIETGEKTKHLPEDVKKYLVTVQWFVNTEKDSEAIWRIVKNDPAQFIEDQPHEYKFPATVSVTEVK